MDNSSRPRRIPDSARRGAWPLSLAVTLGAAGAATLVASPAPAQSARPAPAASASAPPPTPGPAPTVPPTPPGGYPYPVGYPPPGASPRPAGSALPSGAYSDFYPAPPAASRPAPPPGAYPYPYPYPYPYGYPARPLVVPPAAPAPLPDEMDDEGQPVPDGYRRVRRPQRTPMMLGASLFGGFYVYSVNVALSSDNTSDRWLLVPIFGPLLDAHDRANNCTAPCPRQGLMTLDFSLQAAGLALLVAGVAGTRPMIVKDPKEKTISWSVTPAASPSLRGMVATGSF